MNLLFGAAALLVAGAGIANIATAVVVAGKADALAAGEPYCLLVADEFEYRMARSKSDLTLSNMQGLDADFGGYYTYHGVLKVGAQEPYRLFNWSYRAWAFGPVPGHVETIKKIPDAPCPPAPGFASRLPWFQP